MRRFSYENQSTNVYLVYKLSDNDVVDNVSFGMLTSTKIPGLTKALFYQMNDDKFIKYDITSKISIRQLLSGSVKPNIMLGIFSKITDILLTLPTDYLLKEHMCILDPEYIFIDPSTHSVDMICLPFEFGNTSKCLYEFIRETINSTNYDTKEDNSYIANILNFLNLPVEQRSLGMLKELIDDLSGDNKKRLLNDGSQNDSKDDKKIFDLDDFDSETFTLIKTKRISPRLIRKSTGEIIKIDKKIFRIGRKAPHSIMENDYNIKTSNCIGRHHCHIIAEGEKFYIVDDNSQNHTFINGEPIPSSTETELYDKCIFSLANTEEFEFRLY